MTLHSCLQSIPPDNNQVDFNPLEVLTNVHEHIQFATELIDRHPFPYAIQTELQQHITFIQQKLTNPSFNLAIIGEFSSGKSTFINALLRDDLLKTSALVATATATRLHYGQALQVEVKFKGDRPGTLTTHPNAHNITIPWLPNINGLDNRSFVQHITADDAICQHIVDVTITHSASFLSQNITLIDTPGTNATNPLHGAITRQVVDQEADAAIIIIPATTPLSQSLSTFLAEALRPYLHRCIFVITRMDQVRPSEQEILLEDVRSRLVQQLNINPNLYPCSAQVVLDDLNGDPILDVHKAWKDQFSQLEITLLNHLQQGRSLSIAEHLLRLLNRLFEQLEEPMRSQQRDYEQHQAAIKKEQVPDFSHFKTQQQSACQTEIYQICAQVSRQMNQIIEHYRESALQSIRDAIMDTNEIETLNQIVQIGVGEILQKQQNLLQQEIQQQLDEFHKLGLQIGQKFDQKFAAVYQRLKALGGAIIIYQPDLKATLQLPTSVLSSVQSSQKLMTDKTEGLAWGGAAAGALLGTTIFPGLGTVVGGVIGGFLSVGMFAPSLQERQQTLWNQLQPLLVEHFSTFQGQVQQTTETYAQQMIKALERRIADYTTQYQQAIDSLLQAQQTKLNELQCWHEVVQSDLQMIEQRRQTLSNQQHRLAHL